MNTADERKFVPLGKEERENLIACVTDVLKEEKDDEVLESIAEVVQDLKQNVGMREAFKSFRETGWAFIKKTENSKNVCQLEGTSSVMDKGQENLESRLDHETHPMHNELVRKRIFDYCSVDDLKNIRLASKKWRDLSLSSWRGKAVIWVNKIQSDEMEDVIQDGSGYRETPFKHYKVDYSSYLLSFERAVEFLDTFRSSVQHLHLNFDDSVAISALLMLFDLPELRTATLQFPVADLLKEYESMISGGGKCPFQNIQPSTSNLRKLELHMNINDVFYESEIQFPWKRIFENLPSLNSLRVTYEQEGPGHLSNLDKINLQDIIQSLCEIRKERNFSILNLEELDIFDTDHPLRGGYSLHRGIASYIVESQFPLKRLRIRLGPIADPSAVFNLLESYGETLQYLKCNNGLSGNHFVSKVLKFPLAPFLPSTVVLPNLKEIVFVNGCVLAFRALGSLDVPNLETLRIERPTNLNSETSVQVDIRKIVPASETFYGTSFLPSLNKFFYSGPKSFRSSELQGLAKVMPNVTDLRIPLGDIETFPNVCDLWPRLQSLHVVASDKTYLHFDDYAVTGLSVETKWGDDDLGVGAESRGPNITNLKELRRFVLETKLLENSLRPRVALITDLSAVYGFLQLPELRILQLETLCRFSTKVKSALESQLFELKIKDLPPLRDAGDNDNDSSDNDNPVVDDTDSSEDDHVHDHRSDSDDSSNW